MLEMILREPRMEDWLDRLKSTCLHNDAILILRGCHRTSRVCTRAGVQDS